MAKDIHLFYQVVQWQEMTLPLAYTSEGLACVGSFNSTIESMCAWFDPDNRWHWQAHQGRDSVYATQLLEYLEGKRHKFEFPIVFLKGTAFQQAVWRALCEISYGETSNYSAVAQKVGRPRAVRATGSAIGKNPLTIVVPCHRVLAKSGALGGFSGGLAMKRLLLAIESTHS